MLPLHHSPKAAGIRTQATRFEDEVTIFYAAVLVPPDGIEPTLNAYRAPVLPLNYRGKILINLMGQANQ